MQGAYGNTKIECVAVRIVLGPHLDAQGSELQVEGSGRVPATAHILSPPNRRRRLASSRTQAGHPEAGTSCHSPVVGS